MTSADAYGYMGGMETAPTSPSRARVKIEQGWHVTMPRAYFQPFSTWILNVEPYVDARLVSAGPTVVRYWTSSPRVLDWLAAHTGPGRKYPAGWYTDGAEYFEVVEDGPDRCGQVAVREGDDIVCWTPRPGWRRVRSSRRIAALSAREARTP